MEAGEFRRELTENILPFWIDRVVDRAGHTFYGSLTNDLVLDRTVERGALLTSRILWTYAAAYRQYLDPAYLAAKERLAAMKPAKKVASKRRKTGKRAGRGKRKA